MSATLFPPILGMLCLVKDSLSTRFNFRNLTCTWIKVLYCRIVTIKHKSTDDAKNILKALLVEAIVNR